MSARRRSTWAPTTGQHLQQCLRPERDLRRGYMFGNPNRNPTNDFSSVNLACCRHHDTVQGSGWYQQHGRRGSRTTYRPIPVLPAHLSLNHDFYSNYNSLQVSFEQVGRWLLFGAELHLLQERWRRRPPTTTRSSIRSTCATITTRSPSTARVFNVHYLVDFGKRYKGETLLGAACQRVADLRHLLCQSGFDIPSGQGENFGFGYGRCRCRQVFTVQQANPRPRFYRSAASSTTFLRTRTAISTA